MVFQNHRNSNSWIFCFEQHDQYFEVNAPYLMAIPQASCVESIWKNSLKNNETDNMKCQNEAVSTTRSNMTGMRMSLVTKFCFHKIHL